MKAFIISCLTALTIAAFSACESDDDHDRDHHNHGRTTTTTTEETTSHRPVETTTETRTIRAN